MSITLNSIEQTVHDVVQKTPVTDMHTHLFAPHFGKLLLWGIDELLTYHYLLAEVMRVAPMPMGTYWKLPLQQKADYIWDHLFIRRSPVSEATRGVITCLQSLGLDPAERNLEKIRAYYNEQNVDTYIDHVMEVANLTAMVMTNDPFDPQETPVWKHEGNPDPRFQAALRIDPLLVNWDQAHDVLKDQGFDVDKRLNEKTLSSIRKFLETWGETMNPRYMAVSLPPTFTYPNNDECTTIIDSCILPFAKERNIPFALMIGVKKLLNPDLQLAGDSVGKSDIRSLEQLCLRNPDNRFFVTFLSRENQHEHCITARKFHNLMPFGCWWFMNNPSIIEEITRERFELLGLSFIPQHSDARVLDQVVYKWNHSRCIIADVLTDKYSDIIRVGWNVTREEIERDVKLLFQDNFTNFVKGN
jgi:hypothetical protein